jgi:CRISPR-associated protein Csy2
VEEGRAHMEISLVIAVKDYLTAKNGEYFAEDVLKAAQGMRLAGGSLLPTRNGKRYEAQWWPLADDLEGQADVFRKLRRRLLPGFALVQRADLLRERLEELRNPPAAETNSSATSLDALLDLSRLNIDPVAIDPAQPDTVEWRVRRRPGWLGPLPIGYAGISPLYAPGEVENARDDATPFRFVESLYSLGEWVGPHRLENLQQLLWHTEADTENGIYRCINRYTETTSTPSMASHKE